jgi:hypothetical protein
MSLLTPVQIKELAARINTFIDIPFVPESWEQELLEQAITLILTLLEEALPESMRKLIASTDGLENSSSLSAMIPGLVEKIVSKITLLIPSQQLRQIVELVISFVLKSMKKDSSALKLLGT